MYISHSLAETVLVNKSNLGDAHFLGSHFKSESQSPFPAPATPARHDSPPPFLLFPRHLALSGALSFLLRAAGNGRLRGQKRQIQAKGQGCQMEKKKTRKKGAFSTLLVTFKYALHFCSSQLDSAVKEA